MSNSQSPLDEIRESVARMSRPPAEYVLVRSRAWIDAAVAAGVIKPSEKLPGTWFRPFEFTVIRIYESVNMPADDH